MATICSLLYDCMFKVEALYYGKVLPGFHIAAWVSKQHSHNFSNEAGVSETLLTGGEMILAMGPFFSFRELQLLKETLLGGFRKMNAKLTKHYRYSF